jgi:hypothetical protein
MTLDHSTHLARSVIRSTNFDHRNSSLLVLVGLFSNTCWTVSLFVRKKQQLFIISLCCWLMDGSNQTEFQMQGIVGIGGGKDWWGSGDMRGSPQSLRGLDPYVGEPVAIKQGPRKNKILG